MFYFGNIFCFFQKTRLVGDDKHALKAFEKELYVLKRLRHPLIIQLEASFRQGDKANIFLFFFFFFWRVASFFFSSSSSSSIFGLFPSSSSSSILGLSCAAVLFSRNFARFLGQQRE